MRKSEIHFICPLNRQKLSTQSLSSPIIKVAVKRLVQLLITTSSLLALSLSSFCQTQKIDTNNLKRELDGLLKKYGVKSTGFSINVISIDQKGGQTAYQITNNYYSDPNYIPDADNFRVTSSDNYDGIKVLLVSPKRGVWTTPFVLFDSSKGQPARPIYYGTSHPMSLTLHIGNSDHVMVGIRLDNPCSPNNPLPINFANDKDGYFCFGDFGYDTRYYIYHDGKAFQIPIKK